MIGLTFFTVGLFESLHLLSFPGMPSFLSPSNTQKEIYFWLAARIFGSSYLLIAAFIHPKTRITLVNPPTVATIALLIVGGVSLSIIYFEPYLPKMFIEGKGLTSLKIGLEYLVIAISVAAIFAYRYKTTLDTRSVFYLEIALLLTIFSEFSFTKYTNSRDTYNLIGHIFQVLGFYYIFQALFIQPLFRPYEELRKAKAEATEEFILRKKLEDLNNKLRLLNRLSEEIIANPDMKKRLRLICKNASGLVHCDSSIVAMWDENRDRIFYPYAYNMPKHITEISAPFGDTICTKVIQTGKCLLLTDYSRQPRALKEFVELGVENMAAVPLIVENKTIGALIIFGFHKTKAFSEADLVLLESLANQAALAIEGARLYEQQRYIAQTLQTSFLPSHLTSQKELDIGLSFVSATRAAMIGGDFFDIFNLPDKLVAFFMGDVAGRGITTTAFTAAVKYTLRAFALENSSPSSVLTRTNRTIYRQQDYPFVTLFYAVLDTKTRELRYANAGHTPPIISPKMKEHIKNLHTGDIPLGVEENYQFIEYSSILNPGERVVIFTDGLLDVRRDKETFGEDRVVSNITVYNSLNPQSLTERLIDEAKEFAQGTTIRDDIAIMAIEIIKK